MRLMVAAVGRLKGGPERELAERYRERAAKAGRAIGIRAVEIVEIEESRSRSAQVRMAEEGAKLMAALPKDGAAVALDAGGQGLSSAELAARLARWRDAGRPVCFFIGGPDGLPADLRQRADLALSFGAATWPHQLVRIMLLEQLYRAVTILSGHPYHRA